MKKLFVLFFIMSMILSSCGLANWSRETNLTGDMKKGIKEFRYGEFVVAECFTHNGITIFRFIDAGHTRYFAVNKNTNEISSVISTTNSGGKNPIFEDDSVIISK